MKHKQIFIEVKERTQNALKLEKKEMRNILEQSLVHGVDDEVR